MTQVDFLEQAEQAIMNSEIQEIAKKLSEYGLGICLPHFHNEDGEFLPLPSEMISIERKLIVSFQPVNQVTDFQPVAWRWDKDTQNITACAGCNAGRLCN